LRNAGMSCCCDLSWYTKIMKHLLLINAIAILLYMTGWFVVARARKRLDTVDNAWGGGYFVMAWVVAALHHSWLTLLIAILVSIWAIRLTLHIAKRNAKRSEDPRYVALSQKWKGNYWLRAYFSIFILQGVLIWIIGLPINLAGNLSVRHQLAFGIIGTIIWIKGYAIEALADRQLRHYLEAKPDKKSVLDSGLWRYSRHPNYFGEILQWYGVAIIASGVHYGWIGLIGPTVLYITIRYASGIPPIENRRKDNPAYQAYAQRTSILFPWPPQR
jgi:steroid 5-alpha reductase family enzyme